MKLVLLRHGVTKENLERRFLGVTDVPLAPEGEEQAKEKSGKLPRVEHIYVSPLMRCRQTAALFWPEAEQTVIPPLRETDFGPFEGKTHEELKDNPLYNQWISDPDDPSIVPQVENVMECALRSTRGLATLVSHALSHGYQMVGVVSHGGTLMSMLARHCVPERDYYSWKMDNCGGYLVELEPGDELKLKLLESI